MKCVNPYALAAAAVGTAALVAAIRRIAAAPVPDEAVVVVTGGSRGLGFGIASRFAHRPVRLVLVARKMNELQAAQQRLLERYPHLQPQSFYLIAADLSRSEECRRVVEETFARFGRLDVLVNNAGIIGVGPIENLSADDFEYTMRVNFLAAMQITRAALSHLLQQTPAFGWKHRAAIVNIASIGGKIAVPHMLPYTAAKFALVGFSEGLYAEISGKGVHVMTVCPGLMRTGGEEHAIFHGNKEAEAEWFKFAAKTPGIATTVEHAAERIYRGLAKGRSEITITPQATLGARFAGIAPGTLARLSRVANDWVLPDPVSE